jgi:tRNA 2-thiouridine synthesizing protein A
LAPRQLTIRVRAVILAGMATKKLDLMGLNCPLPVLKTREALKALMPGDKLQVHCSDPLTVLDVPNLIRETGDKVAITEQAARRIVFLIEKANGAARRS